MSGSDWHDAYTIAPSFSTVFMHLAALADICPEAVMERKTYGELDARV
jgi:hypothetical protein